MNRILVLALAVSALPVQAQVRVIYQGGRTIYSRKDGDRAFNPRGIGYPPKGTDVQLWYAYDPYFIRYGKEFGVDPVLAKSVVWAESRFHWRATSSAHARGLMQVIDPTAAEMGGYQNSRGLGSYDPIENIRNGMRFLAKLQNRYNGNLIKVVAGYNAGPGAVDKYGGVPPYKETQAYVPAVLGMWSRIDSGS